MFARTPATLALVLAMACVVPPGSDGGVDSESPGTEGDEAPGDDDDDATPTGDEGSDGDSDGPDGTADDDDDDDDTQQEEANCGDMADNDGDGDIDCADADCEEHEACGDTVFRIATWNLLGAGVQGSPSWEAARSIIARIDADVLCMQEIVEGEEAALQALAQSEGYVYGLLTPASGPPGAGIANACMSRLPTANENYLWSDWISPDPDARDMTRPFVRLRLYHPGSGRYVSILSGHLKAGTDEVDRFRRMIDHIRMAMAAEDERQQFPDNAVIALGDFNETPNPDAESFSSLPAGLPEFYSLGSDIDLPIVYDPAQPLIDAGLSRVEARWEDSTEDDTFIPFPRRLDYVWTTDEEIIAAEVYEACQDDGIDDAPQGDVLVKSGEPLSCGTSEVASDHRPVVVELRLR